MATNLVVNYDGVKEAINLEHNENEIQPATVIEQAADDSAVLHNIIDEDLTIRDPGYLDLTQLTALKNVSPQAPGDFIIPAKAVTFSDTEKATLEACIKKLAEVSHQHTMQVTNSSTSTYCTHSCDNRVACLNHTNNSCSGHGDNCDDSGWW